MYFVLFNSFISISNSTNLTNLTLFSPCKILGRANFTVTLKVKFLLTLEIKFLFTLMNMFLMIISVIIAFIIFWDLTIFILFYFIKFSILLEIWIDFIIHFHPFYYSFTFCHSSHLSNCTFLSNPTTSNKTQPCNKIDY